MPSAPPRFRPTVWPPSLPEVTEYLAIGPYLLDGGTLQVDPSTVEEREYQIPDELYLRETSDLDPDDITGLLEFTNSYGLLAIPYDDLSRLSLLFGLPQVAYEEDDPRGHSIGWDDVETELRLRARPATTRHVAASVRVVQCMTSAFAKSHSGTASADEVEDLAVALQLLLSPFSPRVAVIRDDDAHHQGWFRDGYLHLENILALQLARHISAGDAYKTCQNEPCGRLFVHQHGRSQHGQNRNTGVIYCSKACAKAQTERNRRRRKRPPNK